MPQRVTYESILVHNIFILFGCEIECADAEGESLELCLCESCLFEHLHHNLALRECLDGLVEITVGALVFADEFAIHRQDSVAVDAEQLLHRETDRRGEFYDAEMSAFFSTRHISFSP